MNDIVDLWRIQIVFAPSWHNNIVEEWRLGNWAGSCCVGKVHRLVDGGWSQNVGSADKILASLLYSHQQNNCNLSALKLDQLFSLIYVFADQHIERDGDVDLTPGGDNDDVDDVKGRKLKIVDVEYSLKKVICNLRHIQTWIHTIISLKLKVIIQLNFPRSSGDSRYQQLILWLHVQTGHGSPRSTCLLSPPTTWQLTRSHWR